MIDALMYTKLGSSFIIYLTKESKVRLLLIHKCNTCDVRGVCLQKDKKKKMKIEEPTHRIQKRSAFPSKSESKHKSSSMVESSLGLIWDLLWGL